jgi:pre-rRNA-processing protein TSR3
MNRRVIDESDEDDDDEDDDDEDDDDEDEDEEEDQVDPRNPYDLPESSDDEAEMAELRRRVLASKPFANPTPKEEDEEKKAPERIPRTEPAPAQEEDHNDSEASNDREADDDEFDSFMNAQPTTDRTGIAGKQRQKAMDGKHTATFSSAKVNAPTRQGYA